MLYRLSYVSVVTGCDDRIIQLPDNSMERETGIEPALVAWKATVLPLNYSRTVTLVDGAGTGGGRWIRTTEGVSQQIYSLPPLAAWVSLRSLRATHPVNP